jgi:hypothetical protein
MGEQRAGADANTMKIIELDPVYAQLCASTATRGFEDTSAQVLEWLMCHTPEAIASFSQKVQKLADEVRESHERAAS